MADQLSPRHAERLEQNITLAQMITLSYDLDLDVMEEQLRELHNRLGIMPIIEPVEHFQNGKMWDATEKILRAGIEFAKVAREVRNKAGAP